MPKASSLQLDLFGTPGPRPKAVRRITWRAKKRPVTYAPRAGIPVLPDNPTALERTYVDVGRQARLTPESMRALSVLARAGDEAAQHAITHANLAFGWHKAKGYTRSGNYDLGDAVSAGMIGVWHASKKWNPDIANFTSYAALTVQKELNTQLGQTGFAASTPKDWAATVRRIKRAAAELEMRGMPVTAAALEEASGATAWAVELAMVELVGASSISLDAQAGEKNKGSTVGDIIPAHDQAAEDEATEAYHERSTRQVADLLAGLPADQAAVMRWRFGMGQPEALNTKRTARALGITVAEVERLEAAATATLKTARYSRGA